MIKDLVERLYPLNRLLNNDGADEALRVIGDAMPDGLKIEGFSGEAWTWDIPKRWTCHYASLQWAANGGLIEGEMDMGGCLSVVAHSVPTEKALTWDEIEPHLHYSEERPDAIPWVFKYYDEDWGFCLPKTTHDTLPRSNVTYYAFIKSEFTDEPMSVGTAVVNQRLDSLVDYYAMAASRGNPLSSKQLPPPPWLDEIVVAAHTCHPMQANDDAAGCAVAVEVANRLDKDPLPDDAMAVRFYFGPETIGAIAWLANHDYSNIKGGIFVEMAGTDGPMRLAFSRSGNLINKVATKALWYTPCETVNYGEPPRNCEKVFNSVGIPMISLSRWPYPEYHTSDDTPDIIHEDKLAEMADVVEAIVRIRATDYKPKRTFKGPLMMSKYGLWVDWREDWKLNQALDEIVNLSNGALSVFEISERVGLGYWETYDWLDELVGLNLVVKQ